MTHIRIKLESLLRASHDVSFEENIICGFFAIQDRDGLELIEQIHNNEIEDTRSNLVSTVSDPIIGDTVQYEIRLFDTGNDYASYQNFISQRFRLVIENKHLAEEYTIYEDFYEQINGNPSLIDALELIAKFIKCFSSKFYFHNERIIIFSKTHCEIPLQNKQYQNYLAIAKTLHTESNERQSIIDFINWLNVSINTNDEFTESMSVHQTERYTIVGSEIIDSLSNHDKNERIFLLLKNIENIFQLSISKYHLYLDDFKYSKFTEKLTKHADEFLVKVNKTITDIQTQILAIPLAVTVIASINRNNDINLYIYSSFIFYLMMVFYATCQQAFNLIHIEDQIKSFKTLTALPEGLQKKWDEEINPIKKKIFWHKIYFIFVSISISVLCYYCLIKIFN
ncbi:hypothetical protein [Acinetobacter seifertii]|uniref:hypothetical protein n=2 Tax=Acinetobacter TaxID=469 RepID=UPI001C0E195F|nr:hypothetical protein [Acinetobacter seifertii]MBU3086427.1 hypothetical protein [Acinetobacter seifertii]